MNQRPSRAIARALAIALAVAVAVGASGCSFALMDRASAGDPPEREPRCTDTEGWPIWDSAVGTSSILVGGLQLGVAHDTGSPAVVRAIGIANIVLGGVHLASAVAGFQWAGDCRRVRDDYFLGAPAEAPARDNAQGGRARSE